MDNLGELTAVTPPFNQRLHVPPLNLGLPSWIEDKKFDLEYHLRHSALPHPGTMEQLKTLVSRLHGTLLERSHPLWEFHLIEGLEGGRFALYFLYNMQALTIVATSYVDSLDFCLVACRKTIPDLDKIMDCLIDEFENLKQLSMPAGP